MRTNGFAHPRPGRALLGETQLDSRATRDSLTSIGWLLFVPYLFLVGIDALTSPFRSPSLAVASHREGSRPSRDQFRLPRLHPRAT